MRPPEFQNEMILASAGSGKTFQLTNRFIRLMAAGVPPERIIALTFTRKAAGEFFQAILEKLAGAAQDSNKSAELAGSIGFPHLTGSDFLRLTGSLVANMHRLNLGTLDSFFVRVIRAFPFEFGLGGGFEIIGDHELAAAKSRVYRNVFNRRSASPSRSQFLQSFKESTYGQEEAGILRILDSFIAEHHAIFLEAPDKSLWGNPESIWPDPGSGWRQFLTPIANPIAKLADSLDREVGLPDKHRKRWDAFQDAALIHRPGSTLALPISYIFEKIIAPEIWDGLRSGSASISMERVSHTLSPDACRTIHAASAALIAAEFENKLLRTSGIWNVLSHYESEYSSAVRRRGKLTFSDLQLILSGSGSPNPSDRLLLSQIPGHDARLQIDYRLDAKFDHWLLDEFQDTNHHQWKVVENLIDEAVQDDSDQRTLFVVGDIKQAIYGWRGGDVRLFREIYDHYNQHETRIHRRPLNDSWRSGPAVIDTVNRVFGARHILQSLFPSDAVARWEWEDHRSRKDYLTGCACLLHPTAPEIDSATGTDAGKPAARYRTLLAILDSVRPAENNLSCAILVQSNNQCHAVTDFIRTHSQHRVFDESDTTVADDSPAAGALLSLLRFAAHPGDSLAEGHVKMTPLAGVIASLDLGPHALVRSILREIADHGFETFFRSWLKRLEIHTGSDIDPFNRRRVEQLAEAARAFDSNGDRDIDSFLDFAKSFTVRDTVAPGVVQVMTIHKSKGLGFDVVFLPDLQGNSLALARDGIGVGRSEARDIRWVFDLPPKTLANFDPVLRSYRASQEADACYEELCKLYVAMTRAKRALYIITDPGAAKSSSNNFPKLLLETLSGDTTQTLVLGDREIAVTFAAGDLDWHRSLTPPPPDPVPPAPATAPAPTVFPPRHHLPRRTPSGSESHAVSARVLFSRRGKSAREFGTAVHALFECIPWSDGLTPSDLRAAFHNAPIPDAVRGDAEEHVIACLSHPSAIGALSKPSEDALCWLERKFELVLDGEWISGTFDRVVVEPHRATILDFKTDTLDSEEAIQNAVAGYRPQLKLYRSVLSRITSLPQDAIRCQLLFSRLHRLVDVDTGPGG